MDRGAWWVTVYRVAKSQTRLSYFTSLHRFNTISIRNSVDYIIKTDSLILKFILI